MKAGLLIGLLIFSGSVLSIERYTGVSFGGDIKGTDASSSLAEINYVGHYNKNTSIYLGWSWRDVVARDLVTTDETYRLTGTHAGLQWHPDTTWIKPFIGFGLYSARVQKCDRSDLALCEDDGSLSFFPEIGVHVRFAEIFELTVKGRDYRFDRGYLEDDTVVALSLSIYLR